MILTSVCIQNVLCLYTNGQFTYIHVYVFFGPEIQTVRHQRCINFQWTELVKDKNFMPLLAVSGKAV